MKFGLQFVQAWSKNDGVENVSRFLLRAALEAEEAGWDGFFLWDHLYFTWAPVPVPDSWSILAAAAGLTSRIKLGTNVTAVTRRRPQVLAKQLVTIDQISKGRVILGAGLGGIGYGKGAGEEFTSFGEPSDYQLLGRIANEALNIITGLWSGKPVKHKSKYYTVEDVIFQPTPIQKPRIPIWIGAIKTPALKRAAKYDGWITSGPCPSAGDPGLTYEQVSEKLNKIKHYRKNSEPFDIVYALEFPEKGLRKHILRAREVEVTWMLDIISALRFNHDEVIDHIKRGPPK
jgi:alkanesulfonate monooxygenase SsuD/methylene tetrahydromethanopterin reductase-like flavin-dependent oxidoreductase (luciferase family)